LSALFSVSIYIRSTVSMNVFCTTRTAYIAIISSKFASCSIQSHASHHTACLLVEALSDECMSVVYVKLLPLSAEYKIKKKSAKSTSDAGWLRQPDVLY
jgi:hypothetical protein